MTRNGDGWSDRLSEYLDDELTTDERAAVEDHLAQCPECRATLAQLGAVRDRAEALGDVEPSQDLWPGIAARIAARPEAAGEEGHGAARHVPGVWRRRFALSMPQLAAAALVVALLGGGSALLLTRYAPGPSRSEEAARGTPTPTAAPGAASYAALDRKASDVAVDRAVADLERVLQERRDRLDPATARVLDRNLATIDSALVQIHQALRRQPTDGYLNRSLTSTMLRKLDVLRMAVSVAGAST